MFDYTGKTEWFKVGFSRGLGGKKKLISIVAIFLLCGNFLAVFTGCAGSDTLSETSYPAPTASLSPDDSKPSAHSLAEVTTAAFASDPSDASTTPSEVSTPTPTPGSAASAIPGVERYMFVPGEEESYLYTGPDQCLPVEGTIRYANYSMDGNVIAFKTAPEDILLDEGTLYVYHGNEMDKISDGVRFYAISDSGSKIIYMKDYEKKDYDRNLGSAALMYYDVASKSEVMITDDAVGLYGAILSPDGESYAYCTDAEFNGNSPASYTTYLSVNGEEPQKFGENQYFLALADDAKIMYYVKTDPETGDRISLFVANGDKETDLGKIEDGFTPYLNRDSSQLLATCNGYTYLIKNGEEVIKVADENIVQLLSPSSVRSTKTRIESTAYDTEFFIYGITVTRMDFQSFEDQLIILEENEELCPVYLSVDDKVQAIDKYETRFSKGYFEDYCISSDGRSLCLIRGAGLLKVYKNFRDRDDTAITIQLDKEIKYIHPTPDFSVFYVLDEDRTLFACQMNEDPIEIAKNVKTDSVKFSPDGSYIYFVANVDFEPGSTFVGDLCIVENTKPDDVKVIENNVDTVITSKEGVVYFKPDIIQPSTDMFKTPPVDVFYSGNEEVFDCIIEDSEYNIIEYLMGYAVSHG